MKNEDIRIPTKEREGFLREIALAIGRGALWIPGKPGGGFLREEQRLPDAVPVWRGSCYVQRKPARVLPPWGLSRGAAGWNCEGI